jgi:hypothetical protein
MNNETPNKPTHIALMQNDDGTWDKAPTQYEQALLESKKYSDAINTLQRQGHHAIVMWTAEDINSIKVNWSREECEQWLIEHEDNIVERTIEFGWECIADRLEGYDDRFYYEDAPNDDDSDVVIGHS